MTDIIEIQEKLIDTNRILARLASEASQFAGSEAFVQELRSIERRRDKLERLLYEAATACGREVCEYRFEPVGSGRLTATGLAETIGAFQQLLGVTYEAVRWGARQTAHISSEASRASNLDFGYTMAGSVVFVFTVPVEPDLFNDATISDAVREVFGASKADGAEEIRRIAARLGAAPVKALYNWAYAHAQHKLAVDIVWEPGKTQAERVELHIKDFVRIVEAIGETSADTAEEITITGKLVGADFKSRKFNIELDTQGNIRGDLGGAIGPSQEVVLNVRYHARLSKITWVKSATEKEQVSYTLLGLTRITPTTQMAPTPPASAG
jgi:hypothetical protein